MRVIDNEEALALEEIGKGEVVAVSDLEVAAAGGRLPWALANEMTILALVSRPKISAVTWFLVERWEG